MTSNLARGTDPLLPDQRLERDQPPQNQRVPTASRSSAPSDRRKPKMRKKCGPCIPWYVAIPAGLTVLALLPIWLPIVKAKDVFDHQRDKRARKREQARQAMRQEEAMRRKLEAMEDEAVEEDEKKCM